MFSSLCIRRVLFQVKDIVRLNFVRKIFANGVLKDEMLRIGNIIRAYNERDLIEFWNYIVASIVYILEK
jgi:hypothetical protein